VKALRRPTVPVWIANRLAREERTSIDRLIEGSNRMRAAQLGGGGRSGDLAAAAAAHRASLGHLLARAAEMLRGAGVEPSHRALLRIEETLAAAAADPQVQRSLRAGGLDRELTASGLDVFGAAMPARAAVPERPGGRDHGPGRASFARRGEHRQPHPTAAPSGRAEEARRRGGDREPRRPAVASRRSEQARRRQEALGRARERLEQARAAHARSGREAAERRDAAAAAQQGVAAAEARVAEIRRTLRDAEEALSRARRDASAATRAASAAERALRAADRAVRAAERRSGARARA
jgi:hypothetical protein